nr:MAG: hypothetical protein OI716_00230 [Candidatus Methanoperedens sp.]
MAMSSIIAGAHVQSVPVYLKRRNEIMMRKKLSLVTIIYVASVYLVVFLLSKYV